MYSDPGQIRILVQVAVSDDYLLHLAGSHDTLFLMGDEPAVVGDAKIVVFQDAVHAEADQRFFTGFVRTDL